MQEEETSPFITEVIKRIDTNGNKKIDHFELRNSYNTSEVSHILSRMVCKHKSEWSYDVDKIKQDTKVYFEKIKNHFKQEYEPQKGKTEAENENLSKHLDKLLESVLLKAKGLYFWDEQFAKKTGLPADGVVWHFEPFAWVEQMKRVFSWEIDLRGDNSKWQTQFDSIFGTKERQNVACKRACSVILSNYGIKGGELKKGKPLFQIGIEKEGELFIDRDITKQSVEYIDEQLEKGKPILVGVDHTYKYKGGFNNDLSTDHFIVIVGRKRDPDKGIYYLFYEVATSNKDKGTSDDNKLFIQEDFTLKGNPKYKKDRIYIVLQVRENE
ncbi:hypothetical protein ACI76Y_02865 [Capnocytophaga cynodegmi]|uniref:hypothetical protein n=1 Tax=Capnocytophaga cynodegmi TaxID=28189 RepID=UPI00385D2417